MDSGHIPGRASAARVFLPHAPPQIAAGDAYLLWRASFTVAACLLGFWRLGAKDVWLDEAASAGFALGVPESWLADHNMALYYALLGACARVFGHGPFALRSLSALCFVASVPLFHALAQALFTRRTAHIATALYVTNALLVHMSQEARGYALAVLLVNASNLALLRTLQRRQWRWAIAYALATGLSVYAHLFAALSMLAQLCALAGMALRDRRRPARQLAAAVLLATCLAAPACIDAGLAGTAQVSWLYPPSLPRIWQGIVVLSGGNAQLALAELVLFCATAMRALRAPRRTTLPSRAVVLGFLVPWSLSLLFSAWVTPIAHPRYWVVIVPAWLLAIALAIEQLPALQLRVALTACLACSAVRLDAWYTSYQKERWSEVAALLAHESRPDDALALDVLGPEALHYAVERMRLADSLPAPWPLHAWQLPIPSEPVLTDRELQARLRASRRILLIQNRSHQLDLAQLREHRIAWTRHFEPLDEDADSLFADSHGRIITVRLLLPLH